MAQITPQKTPPQSLVIAAFAALYIIWGSTYLGIRIAIDTIPPFLLLSARFIIAGAILYAWCIFRGEKAPSLKSTLTIGFGGVLMLFIGNGAVTWAEQYVPTGLAAIVVATVPLWFVLLDKRQWKLHFSNKMIIVGFLIGFAGVLLLFAGKGMADFFNTRMKVISFIVLIIGTIGWAIGSLYSKYKQVEGSVGIKAAIQMLSAGVVSLFAGLLRGEGHTLVLSHVSLHSVEALIYLVFMGSLVGYMSFVWLLSVRPPSIVGTYAYVNPVIAVFLGWLIIDEPISRQQVIALAVILAGVIIVNISKERQTVKVAQSAGPLLEEKLA